MLGLIGGIFNPMIVATSVTLSTLLTDITSILTEAISWLNSVAAAVVGHPLLLLFALMAFVGYGVHIFKMLAN